MKRIVVLLFALCLLLLSVTACAQTAAPLSSLYQTGLSAISQLGQLAADPGFCKLYTADETIIELISGFAGLDYGNPKAAYEIIWIADPLLKRLEDDAQIELTPFAREVTGAKLGASIAAQINAHGGSSLLAASSVLTVDDCFVNGEMEMTTIYLYCYDNQYGAVVVFTPYGEDIVKLNATFVKNEVFSSTITDESLLALFSDIIPTDGMAIRPITE